jgi:hypothetical protein
LILLQPKEYTVLLNVQGIFRNAARPRQSKSAASTDPSWRIDEH